MKPAHIQEFDSLRAIAVLGVMVHHFWATLFPFFNTGVFGVQLFFVLSGYLISGILLDSRLRNDNQETSIRDELKIFYIRRSLRIFPVYYFVLILTFIIGVSDVREYFGWHALYLTNFLVADLGFFPKATGVFWSLAVEEQFYLLWPAMILLAPRRLLLPMMAVLIMVAIAFRAWFSGQPPVTFNPLLPANMDALIGGALLIALQRRGISKIWLAAILLTLAIAAIALSMTMPNDGDATFLSSQRKLAIVVASLFLVHLASAWSGGGFLAFLRIPAAMYIGKISYGIYLYHMFVNLAVNTYGPGLAGPANFTVKVTLTIAVAALSWHLFEKPVNGLKRHFPYRRATRDAETI